MFVLNKKSDDDISSDYRIQLVINMPDFECYLESVNEGKKFDYVAKKVVKTGALASIGVAISGPVGGLVGGVI